MRILFFTLTLFVLASCSTEPKPIQFGSDQCSFCKMNIVDSQHAAQTVSPKGKQFKYDAIECMLDVIISDETAQFEHLLVSDYVRPKKMIPAEGAHYLICKEIKSPMGAYLSAFTSLEEAQSVQEEHGGELFDWNGILEKRRAY